MIQNIDIDYAGEDVAITYRENGVVVEQSVFENNPLMVATSIRAVLICDALKRALAGHPLLTGELPTPELVTTHLNQIILDTFAVGSIDDSEYDDLITYAIDTLNELRRA